MNSERYKLVVIGTSAGGVDALGELLKHVDRTIEIPIAIVQHLNKASQNHLPQILSMISPFPVVEIEDKMPFSGKGIFTAPANYHVLVESNHCFSLSVDPEVNFSRPSIDVLFESASAALGNKLIGVVLTGANHDGAQGLSVIKRAGGYTMVQQPHSCDFPMMANAAINRTRPDFIGTPRQLAEQLAHITTLEKGYTK